MPLSQVASYKKPQIVATADAKQQLQQQCNNTSDET